MADDRRPLEPARLAAIVEGTFALPIANAYAQMRRSAGERDLQQLGAVLDATVRHLATVAANDALAGTAIGEGRAALDAQLGDFKRSLSLAAWVEVLRLSLFALDQACRKPLMSGLDEWFRQNASDLHAAIELRSRGRDYDELARLTFDLLASLALLPTTRLAWIDSSGKSHGMHIVLLLWLDGVQSSKGKIALSEGVENDLVYAIAPGSRALLSLDPFYRVIRCPTCTETHLFQLDERKRGELRFTAIGVGHRAVAEDRGSSVLRRVVERLSITLERSVPGYARGEVVGKRHRIQRVLREEGLGHRYAATDQVTHRAVALEVLPHALLRDPELLDRTCEEASHAKSISHPHLVPIYDTGVDRGDHYLAVELPSGWPIEKGRALDASELPKPTSTKTALSIAKQALQGLAFLHGRGQIHGDLRPSSLLLFNGGIVKIGDCALARSRASLLHDLTGKNVETDPRSDLASLGLILKGMIDEARAPAHLRAAIAKALADDPDRRHESAPAFHQALDSNPPSISPPARAWIEILESRDPALRTGDRIAVPPDRRLTIGDERCTVAIAGMPAAAAVIEWSQRDRTFTIRHGGLSPAIPIHTTVDGRVLPHFEDARPRQLYDHSAIILESLGGPLVSATFRTDIHAPPPPPPSSFVKFRCKHCDASYLVARTKLRMKTMTANCKRCSREIIIVAK